jgi:serine/threonine-protein kinase
MTPNELVDPRTARLQRLSALLDEALDLDEPARAGWLAGLDATDAELGPTLRRMLAGGAAQETADLLDRRPDFTAPRGECAGTLHAGDAVGPYRLLRELGRGGMGEVWLAERSDGQLRRQVALKLPTLGLRRAVLVQRFERERDILAGLSHPHIARLYDAGIAEDGQPYLALEYVDGQPITDYCGTHSLGLRERVQLMRQVMDAVQFAHAHLVIHRDLKPGNVLVTAQAQAVLLDFGIAKLLQDEGGEAAETELTQIGGRAMTLHYAAPEQLAGAPVSTATDVFALGALLYELLGGQRPFKGTRRDVEEAILHREPPRLAGLPADLATIVLRAMKKSPAERYPTVNALSDDLGRWLVGAPVVAQADSAWYRTRKFVGRHRLAVTTGVVFALALGGTGVAALWQAAEARQEARRAQQEARRAQAVQGFLLDLFNANSSMQADPQAAQRTTARDLLDRGAQRVDEALRDVPESRIEVMGTLADLYSQLGLDEPAGQLQLRRAALARQVWGRRDPRLAQVLLDRVEVLQDSPRREEIPALLDEALAVLRDAPSVDPAAQANALVVAARYWRYESLPRARQQADAAVAVLSRQSPQDPGLVTAWMLRARADLSSLDSEAGERGAREAIAVARRQGQAAQAWLATPLIALADAQIRQLAFVDAEASLRECLALNEHLFGAAHPDTLGAAARLGNLLLGLGRAAEGLALHARVQEAMRADDPRRSAAWRSYTASQLALTLSDRGRPDLQAPALSAEVADLRRTLPHAPVLAQSERNWAEALALLGDTAGAGKLLEAARDRFARWAGGEPTPRVDTQFALTGARIALAAGDAAAAWALIGHERPAAAGDALSLEVERARALLGLGRAAEAQRHADAAVQALDRRPAGQRPVSIHAGALEARAGARRALGDATAAVEDLRQALALRRNADAPGSVHVARIERSLAALHTGRAVASPRP